MHRPALLIAALFLAPSFSSGQQNVTPPSTPSSPRSQPVGTENVSVAAPQEWTKLSSRADLVLVPVTVADKSGKHVSGLRKEAFRIEENGRLRSVSVFEETKTEKLVAEARTATTRATPTLLPVTSTPGG
jgi:hypothetical protein